MEKIKALKKEKAHTAKVQKSKERPRVSEMVVSNKIKLSRKEDTEE